MKESEFIELLNLYLDHEISPADAARLDAEVQSNPARRRVYREYCQMQKACKVLAQDFQSEEAVVAERSTTPRVIDFDGAVRRDRQRTSAFYTVGAFAAAAACVAIIFVGRTREQDAIRATVAPVVAQTAPAAQPAPTTPAAAPAVQKAQPNAIARTVSLPAGSDFAHETFVGPLIQQANDQLAWLRDTQLAPLQPINEQPLQLGTASPLLKQNSRTYGPRQANQTVKAEWAAFQFQR